MSARSAAVRLFARALPPFIPPLRLGDGCRFDSLTVSSVSPIAMSKTCLASWTGSRGRLATERVCHRPRRESTGSKFKLIHYPLPLQLASLPPRLIYFERLPFHAGR